MNNKNSLGANVIIHDFLCYLVMHWKSVLAAAVVCALLTGGYSYHRSSTQINSSSSSADSAPAASTAETTESASGESSDTENAELDSKATILGGYYAQRELFADYCESSELMQCDPTNTVQNILDYRITVTGSGSEAQDDLVTLAELCQKSLLDETFVSEMADSAGADARYISELISQTIITDASQTTPADSQTFNSNNNSSSSSSNSSGNSVYAELEQDENSEIWRITVVGPDADTVESISQSVEAYIEQETTDITGSVGQYSIQLLNSVRYTGASNLVRSTQNNVYRSMDDINTKITDIEEDLTNSEMTYIESKISSTSGTSVRENTASQSAADNRKPTVSKKYVLAGFLLGFLLAALYWLFRYSFGATIQSVNEFDSGATDRFYAVNDSGRRLRAVENARYRARHIYTPAQLSELFMAELEVETKRHESGTFRICFVGTTFSGSEKKFIDEISVKCGDNDVFVSRAEQVSRNPEAIRKLSDIDAVCVMGDVGGTIRSDYQELMQYLEERGCTVFADVVAI